MDAFPSKKIFRILDDLTAYQEPTILQTVKELKMQLPVFICVGAQKSGTTLLHDILKQYNQVFLPKKKETKFFQLDEKYNHGLNYYQSEFFKNSQSSQTLGEIDPDYMYFDYIPERIYQTLGQNIKIIFILRNPAKRAYSHFLMSKKKGFEKLSFDEAIKNEKKRLLIDDSQKELYKSATHNYSYIDRGYYTKQINRFLKFFPKENMLFLHFEEDLIANREKTIASILEFIGLDSSLEQLDLDIKSNEKSQYKSRKVNDFIFKPSWLSKLLKPFLTQKLRCHLRGFLLKKILNQFNTKPISTDPNEPDFSLINKHYFKDEIIALEEFLGRPLKSWVN